MADIFMNSSSTFYGIPDQTQMDFWLNNAHLSEEQRQAAWSNGTLNPSFAFDAPAQPSMVPRTMPNSMSNLPQLPMDRTRSAPASRPRSTTIPKTNDLQRSASDFGVWAATCNEPTGDYALYSSSMQPQVSLQAIPETTVEYTPSDYVNTCIGATSPSVPFDNMQVQLTPQWSSDYSTSPSTPQTALMTPVTQSSNAMSRQSSLNTSFFDDTSSRVPSDFQYMPILKEDSALSLTASSCFVGSHSDPNFLSLTGPTASETVMFPAFTSVPASNASVHALAPSGQQQSESYLAEDMRRSTSQQSSESNASSTRSTSSRQSRREREINAMAASRPLAPKASDEIEVNAAPSNAQMARVVSSDGSSKTVGVISKTPYVRPQHPKIMCQHCDMRPDGFRGTHELDRHIARSHAPKRKGFICVAPDFNKDFLLNCKHCRGKKVYGAYYNAAAHLRRAHFHPRKRGRKGKNDEKRGGIGGGDHPAMDWLREHWIRDVEVDNNGPTPDSSPDSAGEAESEAAATQEPMYDMIDVSQPYPAGQQQLPQHPLQMHQQQMQAQMQQPPNMIPLDYGLSDSIHPVDPVAYETFSYTQVNDFQFDAYGLGP